MKLKAIWCALQVAVLLAPAGLLGALSGCEPVTSAVQQPVAQGPADPVLAYVSSGRVGQTTSLSLPDGGGFANIDIETQYNSAAGSICRTYAVISASRQVQNLACGQGTSWSVVPPLIFSGNQAAN